MTGPDGAIGNDQLTPWTIVALAVFAVSLVGPASAVSPASRIALAFLHLIVAAVLIPGLRRSIVGQLPVPQVGWA